uniref:ATP synthase complex subunit 8 n=1 Tax=Ceutorhynchus obstrictus TaxID=307131 RepID=J9PIX8_9CUCU|nr:ATP synthase F0 subunit 8 [Ceutorhynchus obstrictus]AEP27583.1 ATP synthase F0 subunit 8 [Ceutorhynchus obstrictus]QEV84355.1 ATP synthase F0 subunit 8 [Ceutorhynchus obstrictus]
MPQMAPMSWASLYMMFICLLILLTIMNFYMSIHNTKSYKMKIKNKIMNWKW